MKLFDTNVLLSHLDIVENEERFLISSVSIIELEDIKTSSRKAEDVKYAARKAVQFLNNNREKYDVIIPDKNQRILEKMGLENTPDNEILACGFCYAVYHKGESLVFVSCDILATIIATTYFGLEVELIGDKEDDYKGFIEKTLSEKDMAYFYEHFTENIYDLLTNEYLVIKNEKGTIVDKLRWNGTEYQTIKFPNIKSNYFGTVKPYNGDVYQQMALNSMANNQVTMLKGRAGTGKSYLAVGYLMSLLEKKKIDKIIIFCNTVATAYSAKLGFYPGTKNEKLLDSSIGNMLSAKFGDSFGLEQMIAQGKIELLPMSDIRGYCTSGMNAGIFITEAQNMDISLMKLALQRIGDDCICIVDGDYTAQVDLMQYAGRNNGMHRMSEIFRGQDFYGEIELQNIYRSKIAAVAEMM